MQLGTLVNTETKKRAFLPRLRVLGCAASAPDAVSNAAVRPGSHDRLRPAPSPPDLHPGDGGQRVQVGRRRRAGGGTVMTNIDTADVAGNYRPGRGARPRRLGDRAHPVDRTERRQPCRTSATASSPRPHLVPLIGDFHYNGHTLLTEHPACAEALDKYRINPGNVGFGEKRDRQFATLIELALRYDKPVRIGVNWGSLDQALLTRLMDDNARAPEPKTASEVTREAIVQSALLSADAAEKIGLPRAKIILSAKVSQIQDLVAVYTALAAPYTITRSILGLTEYRHGDEGHRRVVGGAGILRQRGIGDTVRISLTPEPGGDRTLEVQVAQELLQTMGFRTFVPLVAACPGCGRTTSTTFQELASAIETDLAEAMPVWREKYPGVEALKVAVMGCIVSQPRRIEALPTSASRFPAPASNRPPRSSSTAKAATLRGPTLGDDFRKMVAVCGAAASAIPSSRRCRTKSLSA